MEWFKKEREELEIKENKFRNDLTSAGLQVIEVGSDGNCLFRAIAL
jgi:hypothetical protein